ncbi:MAG: hypothetical protein EBY28_27015 [Betaproteobacteria bacterium]|nr:hypothetical protein [Betaproteobacteria bacterium]
MMLALVAVIAADRLTITIFSSRNHQVISAAMTITSSRSRTAKDRHHQRQQHRAHVYRSYGHHEA